jgi:hypothetical protein
VLDLANYSVEVEGGSAHPGGNFFLGQPDPTPGVHFYPAALALRMTPWLMLGVLLLPVGWQQFRAMPATRRDLLIMIGFVLLFVVALSVFPKKLNRYVMPIFPTLGILAAVGWLSTLSAIGYRLSAIGYRLSAIGYRLSIGVLATLAILNAAHWHPYSIAYFNPLLGGTQTGQNTFLIGNGEGLAEAADWFNAQPDITGVVVTANMPLVIQAYLQHGAHATSADAGELAPNTGYVLVYIRNSWDGALPPFDRYYQQVPPVHTVTIHGIDYAWIYDVPQPIAQPLGVQFGEHMTLQGYELDTTALRASGQLTLTVQWQTDAPLAQDYLMFARLLDAKGAPVSQIDIPPAGPQQPTSTWEPLRYLVWRNPLLVPTDLEPGRYWLALGVYDPQSFARLPLDTVPPPDAPDAGAHALLLPVEIMEN